LAEAERLSTNDIRGWLAACVRIEQCPSARGLPEEFKTHPTFIPSANFVGF